MNRTRTHTRVHTTVRFANPYLVCGQCGHPTPSWHDPSACGCTGAIANQPCGHAAGVLSLCLSWSPVDGCRCLQQLGSIRHQAERYCTDSGRAVAMIPGDRCLAHGAAPAPCDTALRPAKCEHPKRSPNHPTPTCQECGRPIPTEGATPR